MVSQESVEKQLKKVKFNLHGWGKSEAAELPGIILPDEEIHEVVNGMYEGGFAMLVGTNLRILLIDKKPLNYLTVEDLRFDMINEIDYWHRLLGAHISVSAGAKNLKFTSYNQGRLRKLISHVQRSMADNKTKQTTHAEDQKEHLAQINQQLQAYLLAQHQQQQQFQQQMMSNGGGVGGNQQDSFTPPDPVKPSPELNDYLFAQSLLAQHKAKEAEQKYQNMSGKASIPDQAQEAQAQATPQQDYISAPQLQETLPPVAESSLGAASSEMADLYAEGLQEIYGKRNKPQPASQTHESHQAVAEQPLPAHQTQTTPVQPQQTQTTADEAQSQVQSPSTSTATASQPTVAQTASHLLEINPLKVAYSKLPMALRNRRFGRPSFHSHSQADSKSSDPSVMPSVAPNIPVTET